MDGDAYLCPSICQAFLITPQVARGNRLFPSQAIMSLMPRTEMWPRWLLPFLPLVQRSLLSAPSQMCSTILHLPCMLREGDVAKGALTLTSAGLGSRTGSAIYLLPDFKQVSSLLQTWFSSFVTRCNLYITKCATLKCTVPRVLAFTNITDIYTHVSST